ncbi:DUF4279 domain-containing protein [Psychrobacillus sp. OK032]|uniref:DUF4279 domain-containing protein n=1 Tax=Psychrobacillus sp. OK032 TaxID=1884358 RepID=UPI0008D5B5AD|nr:DUF4279 domain-containing protein [Psychrobacillus sp. OK032]SES43977.1 protein of unknown function [Psychrobacillus sp. OK032]
MGKTSLYAYILFSGNDDFPLDVVTVRLGVQPTKTWKVGERSTPNHPINQLLRSYTGWRFEIETKESIDTEDVLRPLLEVFQSKTDTINQLKEELILDVRLELVIQIYDGYSPGLVIYPEFSKFAAEINAILDVDMYVFSFNEPDE